MTEMEGRTLGRYVLQRLIGKGGMANVYEATDTLNGRTLAVKVFKREDEELLRRFLREAQVMASLQGHHLVPVFDSGTAMLDGTLHYFIVMPFMEGGTLRARIKRAPLTLIETCTAIREIAEALDYIHSRGIIHRDIKSSNVLLTAEGNCYLTDFGIARITDDLTHLTSTGNVLGTVDYVAPELFEIDRRADARSDLYSLGVLLYEMVTGRMPFTAENQIALVAMHMRQPPPTPRSIVPSIPMQVERVMLKALEKRPEQRYGSARELAESFCQAVSTSTGMVIPAVATEHDPELDVPTLQQGQLILKAPPYVPDSTLAANPPERAAPLAEGTVGVPMPGYPGSRPVAQTPYFGQESPATVAASYPYAPAYRPPPTPPPEQRPFYRRTWFALMVILLSLLIIGGSLALIFLPGRGTSSAPGGTTAQTTQTQSRGSPTTALSPTATPNLTATALAALAATATTQAQATATAIAQITATANAQASATVGPIQTATSGQPSYSDALNDPNNAATMAAGWDTNNQCAFQSDGYHVTTGSGIKGCHESNINYGNAAITVEMRIVSGQSGGVFFRLNTVFLIGAYQGYLFEVDNAGRYRIVDSGNFSVGNPTILQNWTTSSALHTGSATNTLQILMRGSDLAFYANGAFLIHLTDASYTSGQIGFLARSDGTAQADVAFSNLKVYTLS